MAGSYLCYNFHMSDRVAVSILVPIYNVEEYLSQCLDSLVNQTLQDIEIICINDGSKDGSLDIIKEYANKDSRVKIIDKKNTGYGDSMNQGLSKARGEYIGIVEPDDFIDLDAFERMYHKGEKYDADIVKCNYYEYYGQKGIDNYVSDMFPAAILDRVVDPREENILFYQPPSIWAAIYKRSFLEKGKISFLPSPGAAYQDTGFSFKSWAMAKRVYLMKNAFLHYRQDNANSSVKDSGKIYCVKNEHDSIEEFLKKNNLMEDLGSIAFACRFGGYVWNMNRLKFRPAMQFAETVVKDYKRAKKEGYLDNEEMDDISKNIVSQAAVVRPRLYLVRCALYDWNKNIRSVFSKVLWLLFPRYRQRLRTIEYLSKMRKSQDELRVKLLKEELNLAKEKNK